MCLVAYLASRSPLPLVPWQSDAPAFNVSELTEHETAVGRILPLPHLRQAGSHTGCGCGFNEGREHAELYGELSAERAEALKSSAQLVRYVREHHVEQIYSCWSGDESAPKESERHVTLETLASEDFYFRERELLTIGQDDDR
jgi:hypothetical protein